MAVEVQQQLETPLQSDGDSDCSVELPVDIPSTLCDIPVHEQQLTQFAVRDLRRSKILRFGLKFFQQPASRRRRIVAHTMMLNDPAAEDVDDVTRCLPAGKDDDVITPCCSQGQVASCGSNQLLVSSNSHRSEHKLMEYHCWVAQRQQLRHNLDCVGDVDQWLQRKPDKTSLEQRLLTRILLDKTASQSQKSNTAVPSGLQSGPLHASQSQSTVRPTIKRPSPHAIQIIERYLYERQIRLIDLFQEIDKDKHWLITATDFKTTIQQSGMALSNADIDDLLVVYDVDCSGYLDYRQLALSLKLWRREKKDNKMIRQQRAASAAGSVKRLNDVGSHQAMSSSLSVDQLFQPCPQVCSNSFHVIGSDPRPSRPTTTSVTPSPLSTSPGMPSPLSTPAGSPSPLLSSSGTTAHTPLAPGFASPASGLAAKQMSSCALESDVEAELGRHSVEPRTQSELGRTPSELGRHSVEPRTQSELGRTQSELGRHSVEPRTHSELGRQMDRSTADDATATLLQLPHTDLRQERLVLASDEEMMDIRRRNQHLLRIHKNKAVKQTADNAKIAVIKCGDTDIDNHCALSTLSGDVGCRINKFRQQQLRTYMDMTRLCQQHNTVFTDKLLRSVLLYPADKSHSVLSRSLCQPTCLLSTVDVSQSTAAHRVTTPSAAQQLHTARQQQQRWGGASQHQTQPISDIYRRQSQLRKQQQVTRLSTGPALIQHKVNCWLSFEEYLHLTRNLEPSNTRMVRSRADDNAVWCNRLVGKLCAVAPPGECQHSNSSAIFQHTAASH